MRPGRAFPAERHRRVPRRGDRLAPRALEEQRPRQDRAVRRGPRPGPLRVQPRLSGQRAAPRLRLRALGAARDRRHGADGLRPCRDRPRPPGSALAPVLVLLRLQRLEQPPRGRLGDDPARLPGRERRGGARDGAARGRLQPARGRRAGGVGGRQARARRRDAPGRLPGCRVARELLRGRPLPGSLCGAGRRLRRHDRPQHHAPARRAHDSRRRCRGPGGVPVDRLRGPLGRAPGGVLQRPDRPEPEVAVGGADHVGRGLARQRLRRPGRRGVRHRCDRLLLRRGRGGLEPRPPDRREPDDGAGRARRLPCPRRLRPHPHSLAAHRPAARCAATLLGPDPHGVLADVHVPAVALPRDRPARRADLVPYRGDPVGALQRAARSSGSTRTGRAAASASGSRSRSAPC